MILVAPDPIVVEAEAAHLTEMSGYAGAVVTFVGRVRTDDGVAALTLEHYPGMTETVLEEIAAEARARWPLAGLAIRHRVGRMAPGDAIVFVGAASAHRHAAFAAAAFVMDQLKTRAAFWKKEHLADGERWVEARAGDEDAAASWQGMSG